MPARETLQKRLVMNEARLGQQAYERREHELAIEDIDKRVAQIEAQQAIIRATLRELSEDEANEQAEASTKKIEGSETQQAETETEKERVS